MLYSAFNLQVKGDVMRFQSRFFWRLNIVLLLFATTALADPLPFRRAIELALKRSGTMAIAMAEQTRTRQLYNAQRYGYLPAVTFGSGIGYSYGIPLTIEGTAPAIFNVNTQQFLLNFAQKELIKAAKIDWKASELDLLDKKNSVILDTAVVYSQLDNANSKLTILRQAQESATRAQFITTERLKEGIDSELDLKKAQLNLARIRMQIADAEGQADVLRERLSKLTGVPASSIETVAESIPQPPDVPQDSAIPTVAADNNPAVREAFEHAKSAEARARAEHKQLLPSFDFGSQYALLSTYNNYEQLYNRYQRNNFTVGVNIRFPFMNFAQRAVAQSADADAIKARQSAEQARNDVLADTLGLQRSLRQLSAARDVAKLEYEIAQAGVDAMQAKLQSGQASERDIEQSRLDANDRYATYLDSAFALYKAEVQMLRATGKIQEWAIGQ